ncbi:MAG: putative arabinose efflux permease, family [Jatrophihabitantaceae bacterium]|nr:putative arabinose efflux permease, family [Jatrophihabitantaceae bacterium]
MDDPGDARPQTLERGSALRRLRGLALDTTPLRVSRPFRNLLVGDAVSVVGTQVTTVAVPLQVYEQTQSAFAVGLVGLAGLLPLIVFGLYGGAVADAVDRRTLYLFSSLGTWVVTLALLLQALLHVDSVPVLLALVAIQSATFAMGSSARGAIIPRIVPMELVPAANTLNFTVGNIGQVLGPLVAGGVLSLSNGFVWAYGIDAVLFTAALYSCFRLPPIPPTGERAGALGLRSVVDGLRFIGSNPVLLMSFLVDIVAMVFAMPRALYPEVADDRFGGNVGPLYAAIAIGAVVAGLASGWVGRVLRQGRALTYAIVAWGIAIALSGLAHSLWLVVALLALAGAADFVSAVYRQTILQTYAPDEMRGRMQGVFIAVVAGGPRLGDVRAGGTAQLTGATASWAGGGIICVVIVVVAGLLVRPFWRYSTADPRT